MEWTKGGQKLFYFFYPVYIHTLDKPNQIIMLTIDILALTLVLLFFRYSILSRLYIWQIGQSKLVHLKIQMYGIHVKFHNTLL